MSSSAALRAQYRRLTILKQELTRRLTEQGINYYHPHTKQETFHRSTKRNRWMFGGNRTGKTVSGGAEAVWYATGKHPYKQVKTPNRGWVVSLTNEVQRDVAQREVLRWLPKDMIEQVEMRRGTKDSLDTGIIDFIKLTNGSIIGFKSCEQGREKFQGTSQHWIWFDEEPPADIYAECKMRVVDTRGEIWGTMTPLQGLTWVYDVVYMNEKADAEIQYWLMQWADNPHLSPDEIAQLEATMTEDERAARQYGKFVAMSGLVYKEFDEDIHVIDPFDVPVSWFDNISIDPGLDAPLSAHFYAVDPVSNTVYVIEEHYQAGQSVEWHADELRKIAKRLGWPLSPNGYLQTLIDSAANQKTLAAEKTVTELFWEHKVMADTGVEKDVWTGIQRVKQFLKLRPHSQPDVWPRGKPKLFIFRNCVNMIREIKSYRWKPQQTAQDGPEKPVKKNDHAMDDLKYYIMSRPELAPEGPSVQNAVSHVQQLDQKHLPAALRDEDDPVSWHDL